MLETNTKYFQAMYAQKNKKQKTSWVGHSLHGSQVWLPLLHNPLRAATSRERAEGLDHTGTLPLLLHSTL